MSIILTNCQINRELLEYFIEHLKATGNKSAKTIRNIERDLNKFLNFVERNVSEAVINSESIKDFIEILKQEYLESSFVSKLSSLRQFVNWLNLQENPFWDLKINMSNEDFFFYGQDTITNVSSNEDLNPVKELDRLIILCIYEFYLSINELISLTIGNYNLATACLRHRDTDIKANDELHLRLKSYLDGLQRSKLFQIGIHDPLIFNFFDGKIGKFSEAEIRKKLFHYQLKARYLKRSRIIHLLEAGQSIENIEQSLGVKLGGVFKPFIKEPDYRLLKAYNHFHPRASL